MPERAKRRWKVVQLATLPLIRSRLERSKVLTDARAAAKEKGLANHRSYLRKLQLGVHYGGVVENALLDVRVERAVSHAGKLMCSNAVVHTVEEQHIADDHEWWKQGDATLATRTKFEERFKLRHAPKVSEVLHAFWTTAVRGSGDYSAEMEAHLLDAIIHHCRGARLRHGRLRLWSSSAR